MVTQGIVITHSVMWLNEGVVASNNVDVLVLHAIDREYSCSRHQIVMYIRIAEDDATNTTEAVDTDLFYPSIPTLDNVCHGKVSYLNNHDCFSALI